MLLGKLELGKKLPRQNVTIGKSELGKLWLGKLWLGKM